MSTRTRVAARARELGADCADTWQGIDPMRVLIERIRSDGATFIIKVDGERTEPDDTGPYTVFATGGPVDGIIRADTHSLEDGLAKVLDEYAERFWGTD